MRLVFAAIVIVFALCSCGHDNPVDPEPIRIVPAQVIAVTLPESLEAGATVPVYLHWFPGCGQKLEQLAPVLDGPRHWTISPMGVTRGIVICLANASCGAVPDTLDVTVPATGTDHYTIHGPLGSLDFDVAAGIGAPGSGHRFTLVDQSGVPRANEAVRYFDRWRGETVIDSTITDSSGTSRVAPAPCTDYETDVVIGRLCGGGTLRFFPFCGRALRTVMLYVPPPVYATASEETASTYSAGRP